ncbi:MAG: ATP-binding protein, partial [Acidimicrobiia bacterium]
AAPLVADILKRAPDVSLLVTSRTPLRVAGEREFEVPPLSLPDAGISPLESEAVHLFIERAREVRPDLSDDVETMEAISDIVIALDGLPLAIELAAARVRVLPPTALRERLGDVLNLLTSGSRDVDERQRTLRGAIEWSYNLLSPSQQSLLEDFSVFRGGATLDTIEATCGLDREYWEWLDDLEALVGHSLVKRIDTGTESRFIVLELIREFGAERLAASGRASVIESNHLAWFVDLAEHAAKGLLGADQRAWLQALEGERGNIQHALMHAMKIGDAESASRLVFALWRFWHMRGPIAEGGVQADKVLAMEQLSDSQRLAALEARGGLAWWAGDMDAASAHYNEALILARQIGTSHDIVNALYNAGLAMDYAARGTGTPLLLEALDLAEASHDVLGIARVRWALANAHQVEQDFPKAHDQLEKAHAAFIQTDDVFMLQWTNRELGVIEIELDRLQDAQGHLNEALSFFASSGDLSGTILLIRDHARLAAIEGDAGRALRLIGAAQSQEVKNGLAVSQFELASYGLADATLDIAESESEELVGQGGRLNLDEAIAYAAGGDLPAG